MNFNLHFTSSSRESYDCRLKIILIGSSSTGKSSLLKRFLDDSFSTLRPTVGVDFRQKTITVDGWRVKLEIWDTAGSERFRAPMTRPYYRGCSGVLMVYDVSRDSSFAELPSFLAELNKAHVDPDVPKVLVGNKCDCGRKQTEVNLLDAVTFAKTCNMFFMETSAKENINVKETFETLAKLGMAREFRNIAYKQSLLSPDDDPTPDYVVDLHKKNEEEEPLSKFSRCCFFE